MNLGLMMGLAGGLGETGRFLEDRRKFMTEEEERAEVKRRWDAQMGQSDEHFDQNMALQSGIHTQNKLNQDRQFGLEQTRYGADQTQRGLENRRTEGRDILAGLRDVGISGGNPLAVLEGVNRGKAVNAASAAGFGVGAPTLDAMQRAAPGVRSKLPGGDQRSAGFIPGSEYFGGLSAVREPFAPQRSSSTEAIGIARQLTQDRQFAMKEARALAKEVEENEMAKASQGQKKWDENALARLASRARSLAQTEYKRALEDFDRQYRGVYGNSWIPLSAPQAGGNRPPALDAVRTSPSPRPAPVAAPRDTTGGGNPFMTRVRSTVTAPTPSNPFLR